MLFSRKMLAFMPFLAGLAAASAGLEERDVCVAINGPVIQVYITTQTVNQPVLINTFVPSNGVVSAAGTTIIVNNAPTQLVTVVNSQVTQTNSQTATVTVGPNGVSTQVGASISIINFPVYINTFIQQNTIINNNGAVITINNAPTSIVTTATGTITSTVTTTQTITSNVVQPTVIVAIAGPVAPGVKKVRRQNASGFLAADGSIVSSCSAAAQLVIENGQLFVDETSQLFSANANDTIITFAASSIVKPISTLFSFNSNGASSNAGLVWSNTAFTNNGTASFFVQNNFLRAALKVAAPVAPASLTTVAAAQCQNGQIVSTTTTSRASTSTSTGSSSSLTSTSTGASTTGASTTTPGSTTITTVGTTVIPTTITTVSASTTVTTVVSTTISTTTTTVVQPPPGGF